MGNIYTVSAISNYINGLFRNNGLLHSVRVKGELSNVRYHGSGHIYFTLKDPGSLLPCVMFRQDAAGLSMKLSDGQSVVASGRIETFVRDGKYQMYVSAVEHEGLGNLHERFEELKKRLLEMGMFDAGYKKPIPAYVSRLGVVTAPTGAAVRDIINVSRRRFPYIEIILFPAKVQGEGAAESIAEGIRTLDECGVDCIIAGRGGGSLEDLWAFNEETVARAIFECNTPIISAVGHETDTTIADLAADLRAPTPSAAAELAVFDYREFVRSLAEYSLRMKNLMAQKLKLERERLGRCAMALESMKPASAIAGRRMMLDSLRDDLERLMSERLEALKRKRDQYPERLLSLMDRRILELRHGLGMKAARLEALSPAAKLSRGYVVARDMEGGVVTSVDSLKKGDRLSLTMKDGELAVSVDEIKKESPVYYGKK